MSTLEDRLRRLEDEREILHTLYTYGHAMDYGGEDEFMDCWTDEAVLHWPQRDVCGRQQILEAFRAHTHAPAVFHKHVLIEPRVRIDGDRATVDSMFARLDHYPEGPQIKSYGRYLDVLARCPDGRWRFVDRRAELESSRPA